MMDPDEVLTGKKKKKGADIPSILHIAPWSRPLSREELDAIKPKKFELPTINPIPIIKLVDVPKRNGKPRKGIMIGLKWDF